MNYQEKIEQAEKLFAAGHTSPQVCKALDLTRSQVEYIRYVKLGGEFGRKKPPAWTEQEDNIIRNFRRRMTFKQLQRKHLPHRSVNAISWRARQIGVRMQAKLFYDGDPDFMEEARQVFSKTKSLAAAAHHLGLTQNQACYLRKGLGLVWRKLHRWTPEETATLMKNYGIMKPQAIRDKYFPDRPLTSVMSKYYEEMKRNDRKKAGGKPAPVAPKVGI